MRLPKWWILAVSVGLLGAAGIVGVQINDAALRSAERVHRADAAGLTANNTNLTEQYMLLSAKELATFGRDTPLQLDLDSAADRTALNGLIRLSSFFRYAAVLADPQGRILSSSTAGNPTLPPLTAPEFAPMQAAVRKGEPGFSSLLTDGEKLFAVAVPLMDTDHRLLGELIGYSMAATSQFQQYVNILNDSTVDILLIDTSGTIASANKANLIGSRCDAAILAAIRSGTPGRAQTIEFDSGGQRLIATMMTNGIGWTNVHRQTVTSFYGAVRASANRTNLAMLALILLAIASLAALALREQERRLRHAAAHDSLTALLNRDAFGEKVDRALQNGPHALLMIDLDDFKTINDTLGHGVGDGLLLSVAHRLTGAVRDGDIVARLGGDEFAILLRNVPDHALDDFGRRILDALASPVDVAGQRLLARGSIGGAVAGPDDDFASLLRNADIALYEAKDHGKGAYVRYTTAMTARLFETAELGARIREAIHRREFELMYQPVVDVVDERVVGTEALLRWRPPDGELIMPDAFVTVAERTGLIVPLGRWVLREACRQAAAWTREYGAAAPTSIGVNVSGRQLREPDFVDDVASALAEVGLPPERLVIEMLETAVLNDAETYDTLHKLRELGVRLALDDFGTAASSLGLLLTCPVTSLKLDRSFVEGIATVARQAAVATAVAQMARALSLELVAEGIETPEQAGLLRGMGYRYVQGFLYHRPGTPADVAASWSTSQARAAPELDVHVDPAR